MVCGDLSWVDSEIVQSYTMSVSPHYSYLDTSCFSLVIWTINFVSRNLSWRHLAFKHSQIQPNELIIHFSIVFHTFRVQNIAGNSQKKWISINVKATFPPLYRNLQKINSNILIVYKNSELFLPNKHVNIKKMNLFRQLIKKDAIVSNLRRKKEKKNAFAWQISRRC